MTSLYYLFHLFAHAFSAEAVAGEPVSTVEPSTPPEMSVPADLDLGLGGGTDLIEVAR